LTGSGYDFNSLISSVSATPQTTATASYPIEDNLAAGGSLLKEGYQEIRMTVDDDGFTPNKFVIKTGVPVRWIITGVKLNGCNNAIQVPAYNLQFDVKQGEQVIEFTPTKAGTIRWSCWMGMIPGTFIVKDDIDVNDKTAVQKELSSITVPKGGSCGGSGGGCGCGMRR
jgi:uncharacterized protein